MGGRAERFFVRANQAVIGAMMVVMFALVFTNVVTRYVLGFSIAWAEEVSGFLMIWITYLGAGLALRQGRLVAIDLFQDMLPARGRPLARALLGFGILVFFGFLTYYGFQFVVFGWAQDTPVTLIPRGIPYLAIPLGSLVFGLHLILVFRDFVAREWDESDTYEQQASDQD